MLHAVFYTPSAKQVNGEKADGCQFCWFNEAHTQSIAVHCAANANACADLSSLFAVRFALFRPGSALVVCCIIAVGAMYAVYEWIVAFRGRNDS